MGTPKQNEDKINKALSAWKSLRETKSFAGMTYEEFKAKMQTSIDARTLVASLEDQLSAAISARMDNDKANLATVAQLVNAVKGDPEEGEDSALYEAFGYVRKSERKSGLKRARKTAPVTA